MTSHLNLARKLIASNSIFKFDFGDVIVVPILQHSRFLAAWKSRWRNSHVLPLTKPPFRSCGCAIYWLTTTWKFHDLHFIKSHQKPPRTSGFSSMMFFYTRVLWDLPKGALNGSIFASFKACEKFHIFLGFSIWQPFENFQVLGIYWQTYWG